MSKHVFACYLETITPLSQSLKTQETLTHKDPALWNRIIKVLRIKPGEQFILFDGTTTVTLRATEQMLETPRLISAVLEKKELPAPLAPNITLYLPILKKESLEHAIYAATALGVNKIVPVQTQYSQKKYTEKEGTRLKKIIIAACEQAKYFAIPELTSPESLAQVIEQAPGTRIVFHEAGTPAHALTKFTRHQAFSLTLGPEAGFEQSELKLLLEHSFNAYRLTPTILRSRETVTVGLGLIRSLTF